MAATGGTNWVEVTAIATSVTAAGIVIAAVGAFWAAKQVKESERTRHASMAMEVSSRWSSNELIRARRVLRRHARRGEILTEYIKARDRYSPDYYEIQRLLTFFEDLGALESEGGLSLVWIDKTLRTPVLSYYEAFKPTIDELRLRQKTAYWWFEELARKLQAFRPGMRWIDHFSYDYGYDAAFAAAARRRQSHAWSLPLFAEPLPQDTSIGRDRTGH